MSKITAVLGSALFFVVAPAMLAGVIPWSITHWEFRPPFLAAEATRLAGVALIIVGVPGLLDCFARFALEGLGTPAPRDSQGCAVWWTMAQASSAAAAAPRIRCAPRKALPNMPTPRK